ncbi:MAG: response regulator [Bacteroidetes bacterium]|nr:response regulator [Bacteroidota bacterium]
MKISSKIFLIQFFFIIGLIGFVLGWELYSSHQTDIFLKSTRIHSEKIVEQVIASYEDNFTRPLNDNAEWVETINFIEHPTAKFEKECVNTLLGTFSISAAYYYTSDGRLVYSANDSSEISLSRLMDGIDVSHILNKSKPKCHFFLARNNNLFEVFGATVVPTYDIHHFSAPKGFLFFARYWDQNLLNHFGSITAASVRMDFERDSMNVERTEISMQVIRKLNNWENQAVARVIFSKNDPLVTEWQNGSHLLGVLNGTLGVIFILFLTFTFRKWISKPLMVSVRELNKSEERFKQVAFNAGEWIWEINTEGLYVYSNPMVEKILGYTAEELINKKYFFDLFPPRLRQSMKDEILESVRQQRFFKDYINPNLHKNGSIVIMQTSCSPFYDKNGMILGYRGAGLDVTAHKQALEDLQKALSKAEEDQRLKTAFLNNISHEIRTPMNAIVGYSGLLNEVYNIPEKQSAFTEIICNASNQLLSIIDDIISISTLEAGQEILRPQTIELNPLLRKIRDQFQLKASQKGISFELNLALQDNMVIIDSDETKLVQVISNLLTNAFKFTSYGHVVFGYRVKDNMLEFYVEDTGIGVPENLHAVIFERFRQADSSVIREYGGTGLGLSISKAYVELMGGEIWLTSESAKGSVFYFTIPFDVAKSSPSNNKANFSHLIADLSPRKTVLIAEDENLNFLLISEMISKLNWNILKACNGAEAVNACKQNPGIDIVLMDLKMPVMDGFDATTAIKTFRPELPIIVQSAYIHDEDKKKAFRCGCDDYITKPFDKKRFAELMQKYLGN